MARNPRHHEGSALGTPDLTQPPAWVPSPCSHGEGPILSTPDMTPPEVQGSPALQARQESCRNSEGSTLGTPDTTPIPPRSPAPEGRPLQAQQGPRMHIEGRCVKSPALGTPGATPPPFTLGPRPRSCDTILPPALIPNPCRHGEGRTLGTPDATPHPAQLPSPCMPSKGPSMGTQDVSLPCPPVSPATAGTVSAPQAQQGPCPGNPRYKPAPPGSQPLKACPCRLGEGIILGTPDVIAAPLAGPHALQAL
nr:basic proline-rich protein-like [Oryctolagus cuniculus]